MSEAASIHTSWTVWPRMSMPRIACACSRASAEFLASLMPPALPRPPIWTCALTTHGKPTFSAAATASSTLVAASPDGTGMPWRANSCFPWYSSRSIRRAGTVSHTSRCQNARPHGAAERHPVGHLRRLRDPHRLGRGHLRRLPKGGRARRLLDREERAHAALPPDRARDPGRLLRALRRGPAPDGRAHRQGAGLAARALA